MKHIYLFLFVFLFFLFRGSCQSTMMTEISYPFLEKLILIAKENNPHMKTFSNQVNIAALNVKRAKISWFDIANFSYTRNKNLGANANSVVLNGNGYQYGISISVGTLLQKPSQIKVAKEQMNIAELERQEYNLVLESMVKEGYFSYIQQLTALKVQFQSAQDAEGISKLATSKFEKGEVTYEDFNTALASYSTATQQKISFEAAMLIAKSNLEAILGTKLENVEQWKSNLTKIK